MNTSEKRAFAVAIVSIVAGAACSSNELEKTSSTSSRVTSSTTVGGLGGKCLDVDAGSADNGANVQLWTCNGTNAQKWTFTDGMLKSHAGKCLDVAGASSTPGTAVHQWDCHGGENQQWRIEGDKIIGLGGKCLDASGGSSDDGAPIIIWDCHGGPNQKWNLGAQTTAPTGGGGDGAVFEGFDNGFGLLSHEWNSGDGVKAYVQNGVVKIDGTSRGAGLMMFAGGADQCFGNGLFEIHSKLKGSDTGDNSGPANVLWEASNVWPGPEVDIGEIDRSGRVYMATHWRGNDGEDAYHLYYAKDGFNQWAFHTYAALLQTNKITYLIDGEVIGVETEHPAPDFAHGGENHCIGIMNRSSQTGIEADWVRWTPEGSVR